MAKVCWRDPLCAVDDQHGPIGVLYRHWIDSEPRRRSNIFFSEAAGLCRHYRSYGNSGREIVSKREVVVEMIIFSSIAVLVTSRGSTFAPSRAKVASW
jgi:hypothetical protein